MRPLLEASRLHASAVTAMASFHPDIVKEVSEAVLRDPVVVVGMAQNPVVKKARRALEQAGVTYTYLGYGSYLSRWYERLAIKLWSGWPTFPQIFVKGVLIGGCSDLEPLLKDGSLARLIAA